MASISPEFHPSDADHYDIQRTVDLLVSSSGDNLGGTQSSIERKLAQLNLPADVSVNYRGSIAAMHGSFSSMDFGLLIAVILVYLITVAQFRSFLMVMFAAPMGLIDVVWMLWITDTTLNIESFMGII